MSGLTLGGRPVTKVPARLAWANRPKAGPVPTAARREVPVGTSDSWGDVRGYPQAAMPCWKRFDQL